MTLAANRAGGLMTMPERRLPNRLNASDPGKSYLWFMGGVSWPGSQCSVRVLLPQRLRERPSVSWDLSNNEIRGGARLQLKHFIGFGGRS
jgi:hypothetical protein